MTRAAIVGLAILGLFLPVRAVDGQAPASIGVGYVANAPIQFAGLSVQFLIPGLYGFGVYLDGKMDPFSDTRSGVVLDASHEHAEVVFGDQWFRDENRWSTFNAALLYSVTDELRVYAGAGRSHRDAYTEYWDEMRERGDGGFYWIDDPENTGNYVNLLGGAFFRMAPGMFAQIGLESRPRGFTLGLTFVFPQR